MKYTVRTMLHNYLIKTMPKFELSAKAWLYGNERDIKLQVPPKRLSIRDFKSLIRLSR